MQSKNQIKFRELMKIIYAFIPILEPGVFLQDFFYYVVDKNNPTIPILQSSYDTLNRLLDSHALILNKWFYGMTINKIISDSIEYYKNPSHKMTLRFAKTKEEKEIEPDPWYKDIPYNDSLPHRNKLITDTLKEIEHIILFKLSNYFHKFSTQYKKIKNINNMKNDWYEYVEYGTTEGLVIFLQQVGFTREASLYIYKNSKIYIKNKNGETKLTKLLLDCENESVADEANMVYKNITDLFINN